MAGWNRCYSLLALLLWVGQISADCPQQEMTTSELLQASEIVLYGVETTELECGRGDLGECTRYQIEFEVHCVLKNIPGVAIDSSITIGDENPGDCPSTYFAFDADPSLFLIVMVKYNETTSSFDWDEVDPGSSAYLSYIDDLIPSLTSVCWDNEWVVPEDASDSASCPVIGDEAWLPMIVFPSVSMEMPDSFCCASFEPIYGTSSKTVHNCAWVGNGILSSEPTEIHIGDSCEENTNYTLVLAVDTEDLTDMSVQWVVYDILCDTGVLQLQDGQGHTLVNYVAPVVSEDDSANHVVYIYTQTSELEYDNLNEYINSDCMGCNFNLTGFIISQPLESFGEMKFHVRRDLYSSWRAYSELGVDHSTACHWIFPDLPIVQSFSVCPAPVSDAVSKPVLFTPLLTFCLLKILFVLF